MGSSFYGLLGSSLSHSKSPRIQSLFGVPDYRLFELEESDLPSFFRAHSFQGINVTIPYKKKVIPFLDGLDPIAQATGSVNCIINDGGKLIGYNTDCYGFAELLRNSIFQVNGSVCTIIGNGGVVPSIRLALEQLGADRIQILEHRYNTPEGRVPFRNTDLLINATPVGMYPDSNASPVALNEFPHLKSVIDIVANPYRTRLVYEAENMGIPAAGGLRMLVSQAKKSAELFLGTQIEEQVENEVFNTIRSEMLNIVLIGMPGCGKSTIGKYLSQVLHRPFYDTDDEIKKETGISIPKLFETKGEGYFRERETSVLTVLSSKNGCILATGGGAVQSPSNRFYIRQNGFCVYISAPLSELETSGRPLSASPEALSALYKEREPIYLELADTVIQRKSTTQETGQEIAKAFQALTS